nr:MAG: RNA-dependent RNA polymerase [Riboviria sp.]
MFYLASSQAQSQLILHRCNLNKPKEDTSCLKKAQSVTSKPSWPHLISQQLRRSVKTLRLSGLRKNLRSLILTVLLLSVMSVGATGSILMTVYAKYDSHPGLGTKYESSYTENSCQYDLVKFTSHREASLSPLADKIALKLDYARVGGLVRRQILTEWPQFVTVIKPLNGPSEIVIPIGLTENSSTFPNLQLTASSSRTFLSAGPRRGSAYVYSLGNCAMYA